MADQCQFCGAAVTLGEPIPRESSCEKCLRDLRCCRQCRHYDPALNNSCRETEADLVEDKERRNFCEFFSINPAPFRAAAMDKSREAQARAKLEGLFGGSGASRGKPGSVSDRATDARAKLEGLFKKKEAMQDPE
jgi:hypothetical protein